MQTIHLFFLLALCLSSCSAAGRFRGQIESTRGTRHRTLKDKDEKKDEDKDEEKDSGGGGGGGGGDDSGRQDVITPSPFFFNYPMVGLVPRAVPTSAPVTPAPTIMTAAPVTSSPVTPAPVTDAPVTSAPITDAPVTSAPVTDAPVTSAPVTDAPVSPAPVTKAPVTSAPVTSAPVTSAPVTPAPTLCGYVYTMDDIFDEDAVPTSVATSLTDTTTGEVGNVYGTCNLVAMSTFFCTLEWKFESASLVTIGTVAMPLSSSTMALVGGTGGFDGVVGQVTVTSPSDGVIQADFC